MFLLESHNRTVDEWNWHVAQVGCSAADWLKEEISSHRLQRFQDLVRDGLLEVEARMRVLKARRKRRQEFFDRRFAQTDSLRRKRGAYNALSRARDELLNRRRNLLRQLGDAGAWLALRSDPRVILPLHSTIRTHGLSSGIGLLGPVQIALSAHDSERFLVVENDLTRCLGIGDLTVVHAHGRWLRPLSIEVKTKGELQEGAEAEINLITSVSNHPADAGLFQEFVEVLGLEERADAQASKAGERQGQEILDRTDILVRVTRRIQDVMPVPKATLWPAMNNVLAKAQQQGFSFDIVENGVAYIGVRTRQGDDVEQAMHRIIRRLRDFGFGVDQQFAVTTSEDLRTYSFLSAVVPPIAVWPISKPTRVDLLTGAIFFGCIYNPAVWENAFRQHDIAWREDDHGWTLSAGGDRVHLDMIEVRKLTAGVALSGFSPREIAAVVAKMLDDT